MYLFQKYCSVIVLFCSLDSRVFLNKIHQPFMEYFARITPRFSCLWHESSTRPLLLIAPRICVCLALAPTLNQKISTLRLRLAFRTPILQGSSKSYTRSYFQTLARSRRNILALFLNIRRLPMAKILQDGAKSHKRLLKILQG